MIVDRYTRLLKLIDRLEPGLQQAFIVAVKDVRKSLGTLANIERLMLSGQLEDALLTAVYAGSGTLTGVQADSYIAAGKSTTLFLSGALKITVPFDQVNDGAVSAMRDNRLNLIREFSDEQILVARQSMTEGIERGLNPREQARSFRASIGLTARQQQAVYNYRKLLESGSADALNRQLRDKRFDRTVASSIRSGEPLTKPQIDRMTTRYQERYIKYRSEVIARTEALRSVHQGSENAYDQAIEQGSLYPDQLSREWIVRKDGRERDSHHHLGGTIVKHGEVFHGKYGDIRYPGDTNAPGSETIQCRCSITTRIRRTRKNESQ